jgi:RimJ/RimL family protein N-acetyltransferase
VFGNVTRAQAPGYAGRTSVAAVSSSRRHPLTELQIRTPRVGLRFGSVAELRALARLAQEGIYEEAAIPFSGAWIDRIGEPGFEDETVEFHQSRLRDARPDHWHLELLAFAGKTLIGSQRLSSVRESEVWTGSWLARRFQGIGYGTEMRAAVLYFAFEYLGAETACSDAWIGNEASLAVSRKLGYLDVGTELKHPRGEPVEHRVLRLERDRFQSPVPVEVKGLSSVLPWFGIT